MSITAYQVTGLTNKITATSASSEISITPTEAGFSFGGQSGPMFLKISNGGTNEVIFFATSTAPTTALIPTGEGANAGSCAVLPYEEVIVQVTPDNTVPATIYVAAVAANSTAVFVTPVMPIR